MKRFFGILLIGMILIPAAAAGQSLISTAVHGNTGDSKTLISGESGEFKLGPKEIDIYLDDRYIGTIKIFVAKDGLKIISDSMRLRVREYLPTMALVKSAAYPYWPRAKITIKEGKLCVNVPPL